MSRDDVLSMGALEFLLMGGKVLRWEDNEIREYEGLDDWYDPSHWLVMWMNVYDLMLKKQIDKAREAVEYYTSCR